MECYRNGFLHYNIVVRGDNDTFDRHISKQKHYFVLQQNLLVHSAVRDSIDVFGEYLQMNKFNRIELDETTPLSFSLKSSDFEVMFTADTLQDRNEWAETMKKALSIPKPILQLKLDNVFRENKALRLMSEKIVNNVTYNKETNTTRIVYTLFVVISEAKLNLDREVNPFCIISIDGQLRRTHKNIKSSNPLWAEDFNMRIIDPETSVLCISIWDDHSNKEYILGKAEISLKNLTINSTFMEQRYSLMYSTNSNFVSGQIHIRLDITQWKVSDMIVLTAIEGRNLALRTLLPTDVYVKVIVQKQSFKSKNFRTLDRSTYRHYPIDLSEAEWNEEFSIKVDSDTPLPDIIVEIYKASLTTNSLIGYSIIKASSVISSLFDDWFNLSIIPDEISKDSNKKIGDIRTSLRLTKSVVHPLEYYTSLINWLMEDEHSAASSVNVFENIVKTPEDRLDMAYHLVRIYEARNKAPVILKALLSHEVMEAPDVETLFRANSLASKAVDLYMKMSANDYLVYCIQEVVDSIYKSKRSYQIDPSKLDKTEDPKKNWESLKKIMTKLLKTIYNSVNQCPAALRDIFCHLQNEVVQKFKNDNEVRYTGVSCFLFLRFIVAAILGPKLFGIADSHPSPKIYQNLTLVSRTLQRIANMAPMDSNVKDLFLQREIFIESQKGPMRVFLDSLCKPVKLDFFDPVSVDLTYELSIVLDFCRSSIEELNTILASNDEKIYKSAKDLLTVLEKMEDDEQIRLQQSTKGLGLSVS